MKNIFLTLLILLASGANRAFAQEVKFTDLSWESTLALASETHKPIFVDVYTTSCAPCLRMDREVFTEGELGKFFNDSLICFKMDANSKEGKPICTRYKVNGFPTFLYFSP